MARDESHQDGVANSLLHCGISVVLTARSFRDGLPRLHDSKAPKADAQPRQSTEEHTDAALLVTFSVPLPRRR